MGAGREVGGVSLPAFILRNYRGFKEAGSVVIAASTKEKERSKPLTALRSSDRKRHYTQRGLQRRCLL